MDTPQLQVSQLQQIIQLQAILGSADFDLTSFMNSVVSLVQAFTCGTGAVVELMEGDEMVYRAAGGSAAPFIGMRLKMGSSLSGLCVDSGDVTLSNDTSTDPRVSAEACKKINAASMVVVPLLRKNQTVGVLKVFSNKPNVFGEQDIATLKLLAGLLGGALGQQLEMHHKQQLEERLWHLAQTDLLTGLPNRGLFQDRLAHAVARTNRGDEIFALFYLDVDHFKSINDTYGHAVGDALLQEFTQRIRGIIRASDTFARMGGDEFTFIAENIHNPIEAKLIAQKIVDIIRSPFSLAGHSISVTTSVGGVLSSVAKLPDELIRKADEALYEAKRGGRNAFHLIHTI